MNRRGVDCPGFQPFQPGAAQGARVLRQSERYAQRLNAGVSFEPYE